MARGPRRQTEVGSGLSWTALMKAVVFALVVYVVLAFLVTVVINFKSSVETKLPVLAQGANYLCAFIGGLVAGRTAGRLGWLHGLGASLMFMIIVSTAGSFFLPIQDRMMETILWHMLPEVLLGIGGGVLGANL